MKREAFEIVNEQQKDPNSWHVDGRAYSDISLGASLTTSSSPYQELRVVGIVTYGHLALLINISLMLQLASHQRETLEQKISLT